LVGGGKREKLFPRRGYTPGIVCVEENRVVCISGGDMFISPGRDVW